MSFIFNLCNDVLALELLQGILRDEGCLSASHCCTEFFALPVSFIESGHSALPPVINRVFSPT